MIINKFGFGVLYFVVMDAIGVARENKWDLSMIDWENCEVDTDIEIVTGWYDYAEDAHGFEIGEGWIPHETYEFVVRDATIKPYEPDLSCEVCRKPDCIGGPAGTCVDMAWSDLVDMGEIPARIEVSPFDSEDPFVRDWQYAEPQALFDHGTHQPSTKAREKVMHKSIYRDADHVGCPAEFIEQIWDNPVEVTVEMRCHEHGVIFIEYSVTICECDKIGDHDAEIENFDDQPEPDYASEIAAEGAWLRHAER